jgi:hypothetical protein
MVSIFSCVFWCKSKNSKKLINILKILKPCDGWAPVAHTCNPRYSGGRDKEDQGLKPAWANSSQDPISKIPITKIADGVVQGEGPEFKPQYCKTNKKTL